MATARFVAVTLADFSAFLAPQGFVRAKSAYETSMGQIVFRKEVAKDVFVLVYTSIPVGEDVVRDVGGDSVKVSLIAFSRHTGETRPLTSKQSYVQRTTGWKASLAKRIEALTALLKAPPCRHCGGPSSMREGKHGTFAACIRWCSKVS